MPGGSCLLSGSMAEEDSGLRVEQQYVLASLALRKMEKSPQAEAELWIIQ